jgi:hypothetical protein
VRLRHVVPMIALLCGGCALLSPPGKEIQVTAEQLPWVDASRYRTYRWWARPLNESGGGYNQEEALLDWRIRKAVDAGLSALGYMRALSGKADFVVAYKLSRSDTSTTTFRDYLQYRAEGGEKEIVDARFGYERGTLVLDFQDEATGRRAWRAAASAVIGEANTGDLVERAVQQMLQRFPAAAER